MGRSSVKPAGRETDVDAPRRPTVLVIGYGNPLRRDDGVGRRVAEAIASRCLPGVHALSAHQLAPEMAELLAHADRAIFVDARDAVPGARSTVKLLDGSAGDLILDHVADPRALLALSRRVFGRCATSWLVTVPAEDFGFGEGLSATARRGAAEAIEAILDWIDRDAHQDRSNI
jgi:hydrogenase maturation protease